MEGILLIDKPAGFTSFDVVAKLRGILGQRKIGHMGTLDPMATGVLPMLLGSATRAADLISNTDKSYLASFRLGITTDTEDITGKILSEKKVKSDPKEVEAVVGMFLGEIEQLPPMYSAVRISGKRLYKIARSGETIERPLRKVFIRNIELTDTTDYSINEYTISLTCSKGTYVRSLISDIGKRLGCGAVMTRLVRTSACGFELDRCISLETAEQLAGENRIKERIIPIEKALDFPVCRVTDSQFERFSAGGPLYIDRLNLPEREYCQNELISVFSKDNEFAGVGYLDLDSNLLKIKKNFRR